MKYSNISDKVAAIIAADDTDLVIVDNEKNKIKHNRRKIIQRINSYINDQFVEHDDSAVFWNISNSRITHFAKLLGVDTKDFLPYGIGEYNMFQSWALRKIVKKWFSDNEFYKTLNDIAEGVATYGNMVWKKCKEDGKTTIKECDLLNLHFSQSCKTIKEEDVVEDHPMKRQELWEKMDVWDNVKEVLDKDLEEYNLWEFTGYWSEDDKKPTRVRKIGYGFGKDYIELWTEDLDDDEEVYFDFPLGRYRGSWLRVGVVQRLFKLQEKANTLIYYNDSYNKIASLLLATSDNADSTGNILEQAENGQILNDPTLKQFAITNTTFNTFIAEMQQIERQADTLCLTPGIIQGEQSPSNTTFRGIAVISSGAKSAFTAYHQDLGEKIAYILLNYIFPDVAKQWAKEPFIEIAEDDGDIEMYDKAMLQYLKKEYLLTNGPITPEVEQKLQAEMTDKLSTIGRKVVPEKGWINFKWGIKMTPTDESVDKSTMNDAYFNALNMIGANPSLAGIPLFKQYLEDNGITFTKLTPKQQQDLMGNGLAQQTGGMGQPTPANVQMNTGRPMPPMKKPDALLAQANAK